MNRWIGAPLAVALFWLGLQAALAAGERWTIGTGLHYSSGDYGTSQTTTILTVPLTVRYDRDPWTFRLMVPYVEISGAGNVVPGLGAVSTTDPRGQGDTVSGLGDAVASATYAAFYSESAKLGLDLTGKVKLGTGDPNQGLGTGKNDFAALAEIFTQADRLTLFVGIGYHLLGTSARIPVENGSSWSIGGSYRIDDRDSTGMSYDVREPLAAGASQQRELTGFWSRKLDKAWQTQLYFTKGFANGSPDWGTGLSVTYAY